MKVDLHVHSSERSICSVATEHELIRAALAAGLDGLAFTDHDRLVPVQRLEALNHSFAPFKVFGGVEITLRENEHIVVLGIRDPELETGTWTYPRLWHFVRERDGFMILAHPFRFFESIIVPIDRFPPDGIEVYSNNTSPRHEQRIREIAGRLGIKLMGNSDSHTTSQIGPYFNLLSTPVETEVELVLALRNGSQAVCSKE